MAAALVDRRATSAPTRSACPPTSACTCGAGATRPTRCYVAEHPDLWRSPAMAAASARGAARRRASASTTSPTSTSTPASRARCTSRATRSGIAADDPRPLTVTGGLPYHGGAGEQLPHPLDRDDGRRAARRPGLVRAGERRRHAHDEARVRRVLDRAGPGARRPTQARVQAALDARTRARRSSSRPRRRRDGRGVLRGARPRRRPRVGACSCATSPTADVRTHAMTDDHALLRRPRATSSSGARCACTPTDDRPADRRHGRPPRRRPSIEHLTERKGPTDMAWDFSTEPEFQEKLDWIDEFVRDEIEPLDLAFSSHLVYDRSHPVHDKVIRAAPGAGEGAGPVGVPPRPRPRRPRLRPAQARR